jgi:hypothetical protein
MSTTHVSRKVYACVSLDHRSKTISTVVIQGYFALDRDLWEKISLPQLANQHTQVYPVLPALEVGLERGLI